MSNTIIQAVRIILDRQFPEDVSIGLYEGISVAELRWSEATLTGTTYEYTAGILLKNGIGDITASSDLSRGGNIAQYSGLTIGCANAESLMQSLKNYQVNIIGAKTEIIEFVGVAGNSDSVSETVRFTGIVENIEWGDTTLKISLKNALYKRETNISDIGENGETIPVVFGSLYPTDDDVKINGLAKFVRTVDTFEDSPYNDDYFTGLTTGIKTFPVIVLPVSPDATIYQCEASGTTTFSTFSPDDTYVKVIEGVTGAVGQIRQVTQFINPVGNNTVFHFVVKDAFLTELSITGDNRSWVQFITIKRTYQADTWPCKDFLNTAGTAIDTQQLFSYDSDNNKYNRIADFGLSITDTAENNSLDIDGSQYSDDVDTLDSFVIVPVTSLARETTADLSHWGYSQITALSKIDDGLYTNVADVGYYTILTNTLTNQSSAFDKDYNTYCTYSPTIQVSALTEWVKILKFGLPEIPKNTTISSIYLGIRAITKYTPTGVSSTRAYSFVPILRRFAYAKTTDNILTDKNTRAAELVALDVTLDDLPDFYYTSNTPETNNISFYKEVSPSSPSVLKLTGYELYEFDIDVDEYRSFVEGGLIFFRQATTGYTITDFLNIYELAIIFKLASTDIKKEVYTPLSGRIYNDTWGARKTSANLISTPVDIIEHCNRLQNWSEISGYTATDWGHAYSVDALIRTGSNTEGNFDSTNLSTLTSQTCAIEITDRDKCTTTAIVKKLCDTFGIASYIDQDGYECINTLDLIDPAETITLADVIGDIGDVQERDISDVFCEPVVKYNYDQGSGKYLSELRISNITATTYASTYSTGFSGSDGETAWNSCKVLYSKYQQVEKCPSEFSEQPFIRDYATAFAYLTRKISWMDKMKLPTISVAYSKGKDYNIYKHCYVQLPMHTNNTSVECMIEKITKSKNKNRVDIDFIVLGSTEDAWYDTDYSTNTKIDTATLTDQAVLDQ